MLFLWETDAADALSFPRIVDVPRSTLTALFVQARCIDMVILAFLALLSRDVVGFLYAVWMVAIPPLSWVYPSSFSEHSAEAFHMGLPDTTT